MSILFSRMLQQAEASLAAGAHAEAETTCCQVLAGAATLGNIDLSCRSAALLRRIPHVDRSQRRQAIWQLDTQIAGMQKGKDREGALLLCDELLQLTRDMPEMHLRALDIALFVTGGHGMFPDRHPAYMSYLQQLVAYERGKPQGAPQDLLPVERDAAAGAQAIFESLASRGTVVVRQLFQPAQIEAWQRAASDFFAASTNQAINIEKLGDPASLTAGTAGALLIAVLRQFFLFEPEMCVPNCFVRRVEPSHKESAVPFHQDLNAFGRLMVNVWTPLVPCGRDAPGIEVVARRTPTLMETVAASTQYDELQISEDLIRERFGENAAIRPEMVPGDVLILLGTTIHRTHLTPAMTERRLSMELRFAVM
jgi:hypothetical protein